MSVTVDASVFVTAVRVTEAQHAVSRSFLERLNAGQVPIYCPVLAVPESAAAVARRTGDAGLAEEVVAIIETLPRLCFVDLDLAAAKQAASIAIAHRLRGADAVYAAVAQAFGTELVTWDTEMLDRARAVVPTMTPADWLARQPAAP
jgi:predicted nucleic acid-binding protein